jgi:adenosine deaminase
VNKFIDPHLPFIDLHRHLDGSVRLQTILELGRKHGLALPAWSIDELKPYVVVTKPQAGVMDFIEKFYWLTYILVDYDAVRRIAYENVEYASKEGLDYVELRFSPVFMSLAHRIDPAGVVEAVCEGTARGRADFQMKANLIGIISRTYGPESGWVELNALLTQESSITALDLAGDEANYPARLFVPHFEKARQAGWSITAHAGESAGPESIWQAINLLGAQRIGHAATALQDERLVEEMLIRRIAIECNLTSNVQTSTVKDYPSHPLKEFINKGLLATINTDDPGISGIDLRYEYEIAAPAAGLTIEEIHQAQNNAVEAAFLSHAEKELLRSSASNKIVY